VPGSPATSPRHNIPRIAGADTDDVPRDLNAAVDRIDAVAGRFESGPIASRPSTGAGIIDRYYYATDALGPGGVVGVLYRDAGGATPTWTAVNPGTNPVLTSLPASPVDGQEIRFLADATNRVIWHLRYNSGSSFSSKWEFLGGGDLWAGIDATSTLGSTTYANLADGVSTAVTLPLAGDYSVEVGAEINTGAANTGYVSYAIGATAAADADAVRAGTNAAGAAVDISPSRKKLKTGLTAGIALTLKYRGTTATSNTYLNRWIAARPLRLG
jgi:hypothetical protein